MLSSSTGRLRDQTSCRPKWMATFAAAAGNTKPSLLLSALLAVPNIFCRSCACKGSLPLVTSPLHSSPFPASFKLLLWLHVPHQPLHANRSMVNPGCSSGSAFSLHPAMPLAPCCLHTSYSAPLCIPEAPQPKRAELSCHTMTPACAILTLTGLLASPGTLV